MNNTQGLLRMFTFPTNTKFECKIIYDFASPVCAELRNDFDILTIAGEGDDFTRGYRVMEYLYHILLHDPSYINSTQDTSATLLKRLQHHQPINCRGVALLMCGCLLALGIHCKVVWLLSADPYDPDCHVVPVAYCREYGKWIMFDPTVNTVCYDPNGNPLSILEVRDRIAHRLSVEYSKNVHFVRSECGYDYQKRMFTGYLSKNLFMMKSSQHQGCIQHLENDQILFLIPDGFDIERFCNIQSQYYNKEIHTIHNAVCIGRTEMFETL